MKTRIFLSLFFTVLAFVCAAQTRVLTDDERQTIQTNAHFKQLCEKAAENYASYWSAHDGSALATEAARIKWAKDKIIACQIVVFGKSNDGQIADRFVILGKALQFTLGAAPQDAETIIAAWQADNRFEEMASQYFDILGENISMKVGGN